MALTQTMHRQTEHLPGWFYSPLKLANEHARRDSWLGLLIAQRAIRNEDNHIIKDNASKRLRESLPAPATRFNRPCGELVDQGLSDRSSLVLGTHMRPIQV